MLMIALMVDLPDEAINQLRDAEVPHALSGRRSDDFCVLVRHACT